MTGIIQDQCDERQKAILAEIHKNIQGFYRGHDNTIVYALTGLISQLTDPHYQDRRYVQEKVDLIFGERPTSD